MTLSPLTIGSPTAVLLPGTGSDEVFVRAVFEGPLAAMSIRLVTPTPSPGPACAERYLVALDEAASGGPVLAGGISWGAHVAAEWAIRRPERCAGLLLAVPGWHGAPGTAPGALASRAGAATVSEHGLDAALDMIGESVEPWLAAELRRAWRRYGDNLVSSLLAAAERPAPTLEQLHQLDVPTGIAAMVDDPVHPVKVALSWAKALPQAAVRTTRLDVLGADLEALGRAAVLAWVRAGGLLPAV